MHHLPFYISLLMGFSTLFAAFAFYKASGQNRKVLLLLVGWLLIQGLLAWSGFYLDTYSLPPRFLLAIGLPLLFIIFLFTGNGGRSFLNGLRPDWLTLLHAVRIPVEITLFLLYVHAQVPRIMTFEGNNLDILAGTSALVIYFIMFVKGRMNRKLLLAWNIISLGLLCNIVITAILAAPFPFQQLAFDQPNIAVFHFPFVWLPSCIVPLVLLSHLVAIHSLARSGSGTKKVRHSISGT